MKKLFVTILLMSGICFAQEKPDSTKFKQLQIQFLKGYEQLKKDRLVIAQEESELFKIQEALTIEASLLSEKKKIENK